MGIAFSGLMTLFAAALLLLIASFVFPDAMHYGGFAASFAKLLAWVWAILFAVFVFYNGQQEETPIGFVGVPLWFGGRSPVEFLLPEGKTWVPPYLSGKTDVDMRGRPLLQSSTPEHEIINVAVLALVKPEADPGAAAAQPASTATSGATPPKKKRKIKKPFYVGATVQVAVRIRTFNPYLYLSFDQVETLIHTHIEATLRDFVVSQDVSRLPKLTDKMTEELQKKLDTWVAEYGVDFIKLIVIKVDIPKSFTDAAENLTVEIIERIGQNYQAESLAQAAKILRPQFPHLTDEELRNLVMSSAKIAVMHIQSFEGKVAGPIPVITPVPGGTKGGH